MKCIILAAGYATRLYPLTKNYPKSLLKIKGKTILDWLIDDINSTNKISEFIIVSNHKFIDLFLANDLVFIYGVDDAVFVPSDLGHGLFVEQSYACQFFLQVLGFA